jgi:hypothetical protein
LRRLRPQRGIVFGHTRRMGRHNERGKGIVRDVVTRVETKNGKQGGLW